MIFCISLPQEKCACNPLLQLRHLDAYWIFCLSLVVQTIGAVIKAVASAVFPTAWDLQGSSHSMAVLATDVITACRMPLRVVRSIMHRSTVHILMRLGVLLYL